MIWTSAAATVVSFAAFRALDTDRGFWSLPWSSMQLVALIVVAKFWVSMTITATALRVMRRGFVAAPIYWAPATTTFQIAFVTLGLTIPILAFALFLIVPGVWLALRWSQAALLILDEKADWFESAEMSADLTAGRKLDILVVWLLTGVALAAVGLVEWALTSPWTSGDPTRLEALASLAPRIVGDALGLVMPAAIYHELEPD